MAGKIERQFFGANDDQAQNRSCSAGFPQLQTLAERGSQERQLHSSISAAHFAASNGFGYVTMRTPSISGYQSVTVEPKV